MCFNNTEAAQFFENINATAIAYSLKPVSRVISEPIKLEGNEKVNPEQQFLKMQSAKVTVSGSYFDIVDFLDELTDCSQKVSITNLSITLQPSEKFEPKASFKITLIIDSSEDMEK